MIFTLIMNTNNRLSNVKLFQVAQPSVCRLYYAGIDKCILSLIILLVLNHFIGACIIVGCYVIYF